MSLTTLRYSLAVASALLLPIACAESGASSASGTEGAGGKPVAAVAPSAQATVHGLKCGCAIDSVGKCGNYIEVDGAYVPLVAPTDLGAMAFCGQDGLRAKVDGRVENGSFVATSFAYAE